MRRFSIPAARSASRFFWFSLSILANSCFRAIAFSSRSAICSAVNPCIFPHSIVLTTTASISSCNFCITIDKLVTDSLPGMRSTGSASRPNTSRIAFFAVVASARAPALSRPNPRFHPANIQVIVSHPIRLKASLNTAIIASAVALITITSISRVPAILLRQSVRRKLINAWSFATTSSNQITISSRLSISQSRIEIETALTIGRSFAPSCSISILTCSIKIRITFCVASAVLDRSPVSLSVCCRIKTYRAMIF